MKPTDIETAYSGALNGLDKCSQCGIRDITLFADLEKADFALIHEPIEERSFVAGEVLYNSGDTANSLLTLRAGMIKLLRYLPDGSQRIVRLLRPGDVAGLEACLEPNFQHTAIALEPGELCRIPVSAIKRLNEKTPRMHDQLIQRWHRALDQADTWLTDLSTGPAKERVARLLLRQRECSMDCQVSLLPREDMGAMLGITTETASRVIAGFKRCGALALSENGRYTVNQEAFQGLAA